MDDPANQGRASSSSGNPNSSDRHPSSANQDSDTVLSKAISSAPGARVRERYGSGSSGKRACLFLTQTRRNDGKIVLNDADNREYTGFAFSPLKKWTILSVIFIVQVSMNFNASVYGNAVQPLTERYNITQEKAEYGQMAFLIAYAFGSELWAPWSEEYGRWIVLQLSLLFVNIWQLPCMFATNLQTVLAGRILGGLSSAGGSVTLGMVADMWGPDAQQYAVAYVVLSSVGGSVVGPVVGGFIQQYLPLRWNFLIQLIFGVAVQAIHFFTPETRSSTLLDRVAKKERKETGENVYGPGEVQHERLTIKQILTIWFRPFHMFLTEPVVLSLSLLSGFADALIFTFLTAYGPVYAQWGFGPVQTGLAFVPIGIGYIIAYVSHVMVIRYEQGVVKKKGNDFYPPERRLWWLLFTCPLLTIGLFIFAWTSLGPSHNIPWYAPMIASGAIGIANYSIYMATIDYMVASYGEYSASATGGNAFARDFLAGIAALYAKSLYEDLGASKGLNLVYGTLVLACIAAPFTAPIYVFYYKGEWFRQRSKFAEGISAHRKEVDQRVHEKLGDA